MKPLITFGLLVSSCALFATTASAGHGSPLHRAAENYRDAVCDFERHVFRLRYIHRDDKRLVDALEDSTSHFRSAARHPDDRRRLLNRWQEMRALHEHVRAAIFGPSCYPADPALAQCWERVECAFAEVAEQLECLCRSHPGLPGWGPAPFWPQSPHGPSLNPGFPATPGTSWYQGPLGRSERGDLSPSIRSHEGIRPVPSPHFLERREAAGMNRSPLAVPFGQPWSSFGPSRTVEQPNRSSAGREITAALVGSLLSRMFD